MLSERNQTKNPTYCVIPLTWSNQIRQIYRQRKQSCLGPGVGDTAVTDWWGWGFSLGMLKIFWNEASLMVHSGSLSRLSLRKVPSGLGDLVTESGHVVIFFHLQAHWWDLLYLWNRRQSSCGQELLDKRTSEVTVLCLTWADSITCLLHLKMRELDQVIANASQHWNSDKKKKKKQQQQQKQKEKSFQLQSLWRSLKHKLEMSKGETELLQKPCGGFKLNLFWSLLPKMH